MTADDFTWAEPPPIPRRGGRPPSLEWMQIAQNLRQRPGEWALVKSAQSRSNASDVVARINRGGIEAFAPAGTFAATMRTNGDLYEVYARMVAG